MRERQLFSTWQHQEHRVVIVMLVLGVMVPLLIGAVRSEVPPLGSWVLFWAAACFGCAFLWRGAKSWNRDQVVVREGHIVVENRRRRQPTSVRLDELNSLNPARVNPDTNGLTLLCRDGSSLEVDVGWLSRKEQERLMMVIQREARTVADGGA